MDLNLNKQNWFKILLFLSEPENNQKEFKLTTLFELLEIPKSERDKTYHDLWSIEPKFVDAAPSINYPIIKINEYGLQVVEKFKRAKRIDERDNFFNYKDDVLLILTENELQTNYQLQYLANRLNININTVRLIIDELIDNKPKLVQKIINQENEEVAVLSEAFIYSRKKSFTNQPIEIKASVGSIINSTNNSGIISGSINKDNTITQKYDSKEKQKWYSKIMDEVSKSIVNYIITGVLTLVVGFAITMKCNKGNSFKENETSKQIIDSSKSSN